MPILFILLAKISSKMCNPFCAGMTIMFIGSCSFVYSAFGF